MLYKIFILGLPKLSLLLYYEIIIYGMKNNIIREKILPSLKKFKKTISEFFYGMTTYEWVELARKERLDLEHLFILLSFSDILGLSLPTNYYSFRFLPYIIPELNIWKRRMLRKRSLLDLATEDIG
ncbi:MAG: hypothetical protein KKC53_00055 [Actinobacteria bacterium]|nr:hypothetical protein [Actinomycetota bacterium]